MDLKQSMKTRADTFCMNNVNGSFPSPDQIKHEITLTLDQLFSANCTGIYLQSDQLKLTEQLPVHLSMLDSLMCYRHRWISPRRRIQPRLWQPKSICGDRTWRTCTEQFVVTKRCILSQTHDVFLATTECFLCLNLTTAKAQRCDKREKLKFEPKQMKTCSLNLFILWIAHAHV